MNRRQQLINEIADLLVRHLNEADGKQLLHPFIFRTKGSTVTLDPLPLSSDKIRQQFPEVPIPYVRGVSYDETEGIGVAIATDKKDALSLIEDETGLTLPQTSGSAGLHIHFFDISNNTINLTPTPTTVSKAQDMLPSVDIPTPLERGVYYDTKLSKGAVVFRDKEDAFSQLQKKFPKAKAPTKGTTLFIHEFTIGEDGEPRVSALPVSPKVAQSMFEDLSIPVVEPQVFFDNETGTGIVVGTDKVQRLSLVNQFIAKNLKGRKKSQSPVYSTKSKK